MRLAIVFVAAALAGCSTSTGPAPAPQPAAQSAQATQGHRSDIRIEDFAKKQAEGVRLIDVRTPGEYASGHVPGAVLVPLDKLDPNKAPVSEYPKDGPLYVICASGARSSRAADELAAVGYDTVNVEGGTMAWIAGGHPVDK